MEHHRTLILAAATTVLTVVIAVPSPQLADLGGGDASGEHGGNTAMAGRRTAPSGFEENKGQIAQTDGQPAPYVKFRLTDGNTKIFLLERGIAYQFDRTHYPEGYAELAGRQRLSSEEQAQLDELRKQRRLETCRMDMTLEGADPHARITTEGRSSDFTNYYISGMHALDVRTYNKVTYHEVYPNIDWEIMTTDKGVEHDFIVRPGGDPARIKMRFTDHDELYVDEQGDLVLGNRLGRFVESKPVSYQGTKVIGTRFDRLEDVLSFVIADHDRSATLRIDPTLEWGTYYGGGGDETLWYVDVDNAGYAYVVGETESNTDIGDPGHDDSYAGMKDGMILKFHPGGAPVWRTYYGGSNIDELSCCKVEGGDLFVSGHTKSIGLGQDVGIGNAVQQHDFGGGNFFDALLLKLDTAGLLTWATYCGGSGQEKGYACASDGEGGVYLAGETTTTDDPSKIAGGNCHQCTNGTGGNPRDAFLVKYDGANGSRIWGTFYGGNSEEVAFDCSVDGAGNVFICGEAGRSSSGNAIGTPGTHMENYVEPQVSGDYVNGFIVKFESSGDRVWGSWYGGLSADGGYACATDPLDDVFLVGFSDSQEGIADADHLGIAGLKDAFIAKFDGANGQRWWGAYFGGPLDEAANHCTVDASGRAILVGQTKSPSGIAVDGYQMDYQGVNGDGMIAVFNGDGSLLAASYFGGDLDDGGFGADCINEELFVCGYANSSTGVATPEAYDPINNGKDAFLAKFSSDCLNNPAGNQEQGTLCSDGDICTINDVYDAGCVCLGTAIPVGQIVGNSIVGSGLQYTYTINPIMANADYAWEVPSGWTASETNAEMITVSAPFNASSGQICVTGVQNGCVLSNACLDVLVDQVIGMFEGSDEPRFTLQPNPNNGQFDLINSQLGQGSIMVDVLDATGRLLKRSGVVTGPRISIDIGDVPPGVYTLRVAHDRGLDVLPLVVRY